MLNKFKNFLVSESKSSHSITAYITDCQGMLDFVNKEVDTIKYADLIDWKASISQLSSATIARKVSSVKAFFKFLVDIEYLDINPSLKLKAPKIVNNTSDYIGVDEVKLMIDNAKNNRDKAIISLYLQTGLRASELASLTLSDYMSGNLKVVTKGNKVRNVYLSAECKQHIDRYISKGRKDSEYLFTSNYGTKMRTDTMSSMLQVTAKRSGINKKVSNHTLRHTHVSAVSSKYGIEFASREIGHANIATTMRYSHDVEKKIEERMVEGL